MTALSESLIEKPEFRYVLAHPSGSIEYPGPLSKEHAAQIMDKLSNVNNAELLVYRLHRVIKEGLRS